MRGNLNGLEDKDGLDDRAGAAALNEIWMALRAPWVALIRVRKSQHVRAGQDVKEAVNAGGGQVVDGAG
ncbi:hypothetical protein Misp05_13640 [Micromonospora sp. NBRC 107095]|nr:hypothetical protein Misp05_13640 [Micromonospora sp. NBRC 107095]